MGVTFDFHMRIDSRLTCLNILRDKMLFEIRLDKKKHIDG